MRLNFLGLLLFVTSFVAVAENEVTNNQQNVDLIQEYFDSALEEQDEVDDSEELDDNRFNRIAQTEDTDKATDASSDTASSSDAKTTEDPTKPKKKKKKKKKSSAAESSKIQSTAGHGTQESGLPYWANVETDLTFTSKSTTRKYSDNSLKDTETEIGLDLMYLFVLGRMEIGPLISYSNLTEKEQLSASIATTTTTVKIGFGAALFLNLGNIHQDKFVPYIGLNFARHAQTGTSKTDSTSESKSSQTQLSSGLEVGGKFFMGGHIALKPFVSFDLTFSGENKDNASGTELVASVTGTKLAAGLGLAKYF